MEGSGIRTIAILGGTGNLGPGLAGRWAQAGYRVMIGSRQQDKAREAAEEVNSRLGASLVEGDTNEAAIQEADICVMTVNAAAHQAAVAGLDGLLDGKILVDATARVDWKNPQPPAPPSAPRQTQDALGDQVRVVAAFQMTPAHALHDPHAPLDQDVLVCADDLSAAEIVIELIRAAGMRGYYAGGLDNSIVLEGLVALLISVNKRYKSKKGSIKVSGIDA